MEIVKYILFCLSGCVNTIFGVSSGLNGKEKTIGFISFLIILTFFWIAFSILLKNTNLKFYWCIICAIGITILLTFIIFVIIIVSSIIR